MSASREKKSRQESLAGGYVDPRTKREKDEQAKDRRSNALYIAIAVIFVIVGIVVTVANSKVIERNADAVTIGNHEFDYGLDNMARIFRMAKFPVVCANYDFTGTPVEGIVKPYVILKRNGLRIGVLGICPQMLGLVDENKCMGVKYLDPVETADRIAKKLKKEEKCDVVICLSHLGWGLAQNVDDEDMIARNHDIDLVLGGHSHSYFTTLKYAKNADGGMI